MLVQDKEVLPYVSLNNLDEVNIQYLFNIES